MLELARAAVENSNVKIPDGLKKYNEPRGLFVTLKKHGELRGCIGYPEPVIALNSAIINSARAAAYDDPRFNPVQEEEFSELDYEISVLTVPELIDGLPDSIEIGRDGLIVRMGARSGLLLPQVAPEWGWEKLEFLEHTCEKAGLPRNAWKQKDCRVYSFRAQIL